MKKKLKIGLWIVGGIIIIPLVLIIIVIAILWVIPTGNSQKTDSANWCVKEYLNEFDRPTGEYYVEGVFEGYFNNSATTRSPLTVEVQIQPDSTVMLKFWEYNSHLAKSEDYFFIYGYDGEGNYYRLEEMESYAINQSGIFYDKNRWISDGQGYNEMFNKGIIWEMLDKEGVSNIVVKVGKYSTTEYIVKINTAGLKSALLELKTISRSSTQGI